MNAITAIGRFSEIVLACSSRVRVCNTQYIMLVD